MNNYFKKLLNGISETREICVLLIACTVGVLWGFTLWWLLGVGVALFFYVVLGSQKLTAVGDISRDIGILFVVILLLLLIHQFIDWLIRLNLLQMFMLWIDDLSLWWILGFVLLLIVIAHIPIRQNIRKIQSLVDEKNAKALANLLINNPYYAQFNSAYDFDIYEAFQNVEYDSFDWLLDVDDEYNGIHASKHQELVAQEIDNIHERVKNQDFDVSNVSKILFNLVKNHSFSNDMDRMFLVMKRYFDEGGSKKIKRRIDSITFFLNLFSRGKTWDLLKNEIAQTSLSNHRMHAEDIYKLFQFFSLNVGGNCKNLFEEINEEISKQFDASIKNGNSDVIRLLTDKDMKQPFFPNKNLNALVSVNREKLTKERQLIWLRSLRNFSDYVAVSKEKKQLFYNQFEIVKIFNAYVALKKYTQHDEVLKMYPAFMTHFANHLNLYKDYKGFDTLKKLIMEYKSDLK